MTWAKIKSVVMGAIGWHPEVFYNSRLSDTISAFEGYLEKQRDYERIERRAAIMIVSPWIDKKIDPYKWWPIAGDESDRESIKEHKRKKALDQYRKYRHKAAVIKNGN